MIARKLKEILDAPGAPMLVHVLPEEVFDARRIAGSVNACIYEMAFLSKMAELAPDKARPVVVYGAGGRSLDARTAAESLRAAGYTDVVEFPGGLDEWEAAGLPLEGSRQPVTMAAGDGRYAVDTAASVVRWTGRNLFNHHHGIVKLAGGEIVLADGDLDSARFDIDMTSIVCEDLADPQWNALLIQHLRHTDFFDVENHPLASFAAERATPLVGCTDGQPTHELSGNFTLRGITRPLAFPVVIAVAEDGSRLTGQAQFELDRTEFGSIYGSGKYFRFLGSHVVNDHIHLHVKLHADLKQAGK